METLSPEKLNIIDGIFYSAEVPKELTEVLRATGQTPDVSLESILQTVVAVGTLTTLISGATGMASVNVTLSLAERINS